MHKLLIKAIVALLLPPERAATIIIIIPISKEKNMKGQANIALLNLPVKYPRIPTAIQNNPVTNA